MLASVMTAALTDLPAVELVGPETQVPASGVAP